MAKPTVFETASEDLASLLTSHAFAELADALSVGEGSQEPPAPALSDMRRAAAARPRRARRPSAKAATSKRGAAAAA